VRPTFFGSMAVRTCEYYRFILFFLDMRYGHAQTERTPIALPPERHLRMSQFSHQISFTSSGWQALMAEPADPLGAIRVTLEALGGTLVNAFFIADDYDVLALTEFPDAVSAGDISIALYAGGSVARVRTSLLLTKSQAQESRRKPAPASTLTAFRSSRAAAVSAG